MTPVKVAIVGCGAITASAHLPAVLRSPLMDLVALVDINLKNAEALRREYALSCKVTTRLEEVIGDVEGILIATPNHTHLAVARIALERGIPILIEKPLTTTHADALEMCDLADRHHTFISVGFRSRHWAGVKLLKTILDQKFLGTIRRFDYEVGNTGSWNAVSGFSVQADQAGGGTLIDAHVLDKLLYWFGEPVEYTYLDDNQGGVEASCRGTLQYRGPNGSFPGTFFLSRTTALRNRIVIEGERYRCRLDERETALPVLESSDHPAFTLEVNPPADASPSLNSFQAQNDEFARNIRERTGVTVDGRFAALSVKWTEALYRIRQPLEEPWIVRHA